MKRKFQFTKMHGLGNDFIVVDAINQRLDVSESPELAKKLCERNFGIGADGLILALRPTHSDIQMRIFNPDGSEPEMCGNGIRCFAKFIHDNKMIEKDVFSVETAAGIIVPALITNNGEVTAVEVDMGAPAYTQIKEQIAVNNQNFEFTRVSMGNPHAVVFVDDLKKIDIEGLGPHFETHPTFPDRTNTEFIQVINRNEIVLIVWERGAGETLACGTGACASVVAGVLTDRLDRKVLVHLPGGDLSIEWQQSDNHVMMTGPATSVYKGEIEL